MKILVISDTHGRTDDLERVLKREKDIDLLIHAGDFCRDLDYLQDSQDFRLERVRGNGDFLERDIALEKVIRPRKDLEKQIFLTHGHKYQVKDNLNALFYRGLEENCQLLIFGHTHFPFLEKWQGVYLLNPGSLSFPRNQSQKSYALIDWQEDFSINLKKV